MTEEKKETTVDLPGSLGAWHEVMSEFAVAFHMITGPKVYVVKRDGRYLRIPQAGASPMGVSSSRLATRFDSHLWASSWASMLRQKDGTLPKVIRLMSKAEREAKKEGHARTYKWKAETTGPKATKAPEAPLTCMDIVNDAPCGRPATCYNAESKAPFCDEHGGDNPRYAK